MRAAVTLFLTLASLAHSNDVIAQRAGRGGAGRGGDAEVLPPAARRPDTTRSDSAGGRGEGANPLAGLRLRSIGPALTSGRVSDLAVLPAMQRSILRAAATAVRPGGLLVYSTCSLETEENDAQIESFLSDNPEWRLEPPPEGAVPAEVLDAGRLRVLPQRHGTDGAFAARLRRADSTTA